MSLRFVRSSLYDFIKNASNNDKYTKLHVSSGCSEYKKQVKYFFFFFSYLVESTRSRNERLYYTNLRNNKKKMMKDVIRLA